jgi:deazaflavin-dependent oxidoreductase (nitroreductase family)
VQVDKRRASTFASHRLLNPFVKAAARAGLPLPGLVILETTGRKTGRPRRTPVGKALEGDTLWVLAEHRRGGYVRNIEANPRVRVRIGRAWREGTARVLTGDDVRERARRMPNRTNTRVVLLMASEPVTVRVDLDPAAGAAAPGAPAPPSG